MDCHSFYGIPKHDFGWETVARYEIWKPTRKTSNKTPKIRAHELNYNFPSSPTCSTSINMNIFSKKTRVHIVNLMRKSPSKLRLCERQNILNVWWIGLQICGSYLTQQSKHKFPKWWLVQTRNLTPMPSPSQGNNYPNQFLHGKN